MADINDRIDLALDASGDLDIGPHLPGGIQFTTGLAAVAQKIELAITMYQGEWFMDLEAGVPYYQDVLGKKYNQATVVAAFRDVIAAVEDVTDIKTITAEYVGTTRQANVTWEVVTPFGTTSGSATA